MRTEIRKFQFTKIIIKKKIIEKSKFIVLQRLHGSSKIAADFAGKCIPDFRRGFAVQVPKDILVAYAKFPPARAEVNGGDGDGAPPKGTLFSEILFSCRIFLDRTVYL